MKRDKSGYIGFSKSPDMVIGRVTVASFDFQCPRCGQMVKAHEKHGKDVCPDWHKKDAYLPLERHKE